MRHFALSALALLLSASIAHAHGLPSDPSTVAAGLAHPFSGADHALAMIAVGLWSWLAGRRARWAWPAVFVAVMIGGYALGLGSVPLPFVEHAILASVVVLGLLIALTVRLSVAAGAIVVGLFALFHGHAHGAEAPIGEAWLYALGFALATAALHMAGLALGRAGAGARGLVFVRGLGGLVAVAGLAFAA
jgi:urease accessory protein